MDPHLHARYALARHLLYVPFSLVDAVPVLDSATGGAAAAAAATPAASVEAAALNVTALIPSGLHSVRFAPPAVVLAHIKGHIDAVQDEKEKEELLTALQWLHDPREATPIPQPSHTQLVRAFAHHVRFHTDATGAVQGRYCADALAYFLCVTREAACEELRQLCLSRVLVPLSANLIPTTATTRELEGGSYTIAPPLDTNAALIRRVDAHRYLERMVSIASAASHIEDNMRVFYMSHSIDCLAPEQIEPATRFYSKKKGIVAFVRLPGVAELGMKALVRDEGAGKNCINGFVPVFPPSLPSSYFSCGTASIEVEDVPQNGLYFTDSSLPTPGQENPGTVLVRLYNSKKMLFTYEKGVFQSVGKGIAAIPPGTPYNQFSVDMASVTATGYAEPPQNPDGSRCKVSWTCRPGIDQRPEQADALMLMPAHLLNARASGIGEAVMPTEQRPRPGETALCCYQLLGRCHWTAAACPYSHATDDGRPCQFGAQCKDHAARGGPIPVAVQPCPPGLFYCRADEASQGRGDAAPEKGGGVLLRTEAGGRVVLRPDGRHVWDSAWTMNGLRGGKPYKPHPSSEVSPAAYRRLVGNFFGVLTGLAKARGQTLFAGSTDCAIARLSNVTNVLFPLCRAFVEQVDKEDRKSIMPPATLLVLMGVPSNASEETIERSVAHMLEQLELHYGPGVLLHRTCTTAAQFRVLMKHVGARLSLLHEHCFFGSKLAMHRLVSSIGDVPSVGTQALSPLTFACAIKIYAQVALMDGDSTAGMHAFVVSTEGDATLHDTAPSVATVLLRFAAQPPLRPPEIDGTELPLAGGQGARGWTKTRTGAWEASSMAAGGQQPATHYGAFDAAIRGVASYDGAVEPRHGDVAAMEEALGSSWKRAGSAFSSRHQTATGGTGGADSVVWLSMDRVYVGDAMAAAINAHRPFRRVGDAPMGPLATVGWHWVCRCGVLRTAITVLLSCDVRPGALTPPPPGDEVVHAALVSKWKEAARVLKPELVRLNDHCIRLERPQRAAVSANPRVVPSFLEHCLALGTTSLLHPTGLTTLTADPITALETARLVALADRAQALLVPLHAKRHFENDDSETLAEYASAPATRVILRGGLFADAPSMLIPCPGVAATVSFPWPNGSTIVGHLEPGTRDFFLVRDVGGLADGGGGGGGSGVGAGTGGGAGLASPLGTDVAAIDTAEQRMADYRRDCERKRTAI